MEQQEKTNLAHSIVRLICCLVILACAFFAATQINFTAIVDNISSIGYEPSSAINKLMEEISLTNEGERIFKASRPELLDADDFNEKCTTETDSSYSLLGCYSEKTVYVYNIEKRELEGIRQVTLIHEFLHAVWSRMSDAERQEITPSLKQVYDSSEAFQKHLEAYSDKELYDELHSIVGTEMKLSDMPEKLQSHYRKYINNQERVASYYDSYYKVFNVAYEKMKSLMAQINERYVKLNQLRASYEAKTREYNAAVADYNSHTGDKAFKSIEEANNAYDNLLAMQKSLNDDYAALTKYTEDYNTLINEYNSILIVHKELQQSTNSKSVKTVK